MAIIIDPGTPVSERVNKTSDTRRIASYPIYPSENPGTPYVPETEAEAFDPVTPSWDSTWVGDTSATSPFEALSEEERKFFSEYEDVIKANQTVVFERDASFKRHIYSDKSYSGVDIQVSISLPGKPSYEFDDITTLSVSSHRESFPVRLLGMVNPAGFTSGPRTIAGSLICSMIEVDPFYRAARSIYDSSAESLWSDTPASGYPLPDALPPFDITITFNNEYELSGAALRIFGVKIIDAGQTMSIDDMVTEVTYSYVAAGFAPVHRAKNWKMDTSSWRDHWGA